MKEQIKELVRQRLSKRRIILFGAGVIAEEFYEEYKDILNISHCVSNIKKEWGKEMFLEKLDVRRFNKKEIQAEDYLVVCGPIAFRTIEQQLTTDGFKMYEDFVESQIASAIFQDKKIALFYGQCVLRDLYQCVIQIPAFNKEYASIWTQSLKDQAVLTNRVLFYTKEICDLYVYTPKMLDHDSIYFLSSDELPKDCQIVSMSNLVVSLYWPQIDTKVTSTNEWYMHPYHIRRSMDFYHSLYRKADRNINKMVLEGKTAEQIVRELSDEGYYSKKQVDGNKKRCLKLIDIAEKNIDIKVGDYIQENYCIKMLYQNYIHPNKCIIWEYIRRFLDKIKLSVPNLSQLEAEAPDHVHQGGDVPIYPSTAKLLQLDFINDTTRYEIMTGEGSVYMTFAEYIEHYVEYTRKSMEIMRIW